MCDFFKSLTPVTILGLILRSSDGLKRVKWFFFLLEWVPQSLLERSVSNSSCLIYSPWDTMTCSEDVIFVHDHATANVGTVAELHRHLRARTSQFFWSSVSRNIFIFIFFFTNYFSSFQLVIGIDSKLHTHLIRNSALFDDWVIYSRHFGICLHWLSCMKNIISWLFGANGEDKAKSPLRRSLVYY